MNRMQRQVYEWMQLFEHPTPDVPPPALPADRLRLRLRLCLEETIELIEASGCYLRGNAPSMTAEGLLAVPFDAERLQNTTEMIDAICDLLYVTLGMANEMGIDVEPFFDEVHLANLRKGGGPIDAGGKRLKPPGWTPPDIEGVFERLYGRRP